MPSYYAVINNRIKIQNHHSSYLGLFTKPKLTEISKIQMREIKNSIKNSKLSYLFSTEEEANNFACQNAFNFCNKNFYIAPLLKLEIENTIDLTSHKNGYKINGCLSDLINIKVKLPSINQDSLTFQPWVSLESNDDLIIHTNKSHRNRKKQEKLFAVIILISAYLASSTLRGTINNLNLQNFIIDASISYLTLFLTLNKQAKSNRENDLEYISDSKLSR